MKTAFLRRSFRCVLPGATVGAALFSIVAVADGATAKVDDAATYEKDGTTFLAPMGHNLFTTTYVIGGGRWVGGSYFLGRGFGDVLMIATSPWIWVNYNMANLELKSGVQLDSAGDRVSLELVGFKTLAKEWNWFRQESAFARATVSHPFSASYSVHLGGGYQYFWNDDWPYSLRPRSWNDDRYTISAGILQEWTFGAHHEQGMFFETGILGVNYKLPFLHLGVSWHRNFSWGFLQVGVSYSRRGTAKAPPIPSDWNGMKSWAHTYLDDPYSDYYINESDSADKVSLSWRQWFVHPEIQVEFPL